MKIQILYDIKLWQIAAKKHLVEKNIGGLAPLNRKSTTIKITGR